MPFTSAQLVTLWTTANVGVAPDAATTATLGALAAQSQAGALSDNSVLAFLINSGDNDTAVANLTYRFFTGVSPSQAGLSFLVNSAANANDLGDAFYAGFNQENRYVNFAANLGFGAGPGAAAFTTTYGGLSSVAGTGTTSTSSAFVDLIYEQIVGTPYAQAAGLDAVAGKAFIQSKITDGTFRATAIARGMITSATTGSALDLAVKVVAVSQVINESVKADVGIYASAQNNFMLALLNGVPIYGGDIIANYASLGGGTGSAIGGTGPTPGSVTLDFTPGLDALQGGAGNDIFIGDSFLNPGVNVVPADLANGNAGFDTFRYFQGASGVVPQLQSVENVQLVFSGADYNVAAVAGLTTVTLEGAPTGSFNYTAAPGTSFNITNGQNLNAISAAGVTSTFTATGAINTTVSGLAAYGGITYAGATGVSLTSAANTPGAAGNTLTTVTAAAATGVTITSLLAAPLTVTTLAIGAATGLTINANAATTLTTVGSSAALVTLNVNSNTTGLLTTIGAVTQGAAGVTNVAGAGNTTITTLTGGATVNDTAAGNLTIGATTITALNGGTATGKITATWGASAAATAVTTGSGADTINLAAVTGKHTVSLGAGNDALTLNAVAAAPAGSAYDGGADTDTLTLAQLFVAGGVDVPIATITAGNKASFVNFETLGITSNATVAAAVVAGDTSSFDLSNLPAGITNLQVGTSNAGVVFTKAGASTTINVVGSVTGVGGGTNSGIKVSLAADTAADSLTLNLNAPAAATPIVISNVNAVAIETVNFASNTAAAGTPNTVTSLVPDASLRSINVSGSGAFVLTSTGNLAATTKIDASANTAGVSVDASATVTAGVGTNFIGTVKGDVFTVGLGADAGLLNVRNQVRGNGGGDTFQLGAAHPGTVELVYVAGTDSLLDVTAAVRGLGGANTMDEVLNFTSGTDKFDFSSFAFTGQQLVIADKGVVASLAALATLAGTSTFFQDGAGVTRGVAEVHIGADTYLFADVNKNGLFDAAGDLAIKVTGVANIAATDLIGN